MTFTSSLFLIGLLPPFVIFYNWFSQKKSAGRRTLLLVANSIFLVWGGAGSFLFYCAFSIIVSLLAVIVYNTKNRCALIVSAIISVMPLVVIKYSAFIIETINHATGIDAIAPSIAIPIGISFLTFKAVSLLVDVFKETVCKKPSLLYIYLYFSFFPTVISGPIVRYNDFDDGLHNNIFPRDYALAIERITVGLCKKVLIADKIAIIANYYFDGIALGNNYSCLGLWIGSIAYSIQLYFDFSGYSDMAIGIGRLLGFNIKENFNKPYQAGSITDFWRRWHISLTQWFRDYVYIPLGGNRCSKSRHIMNMLLVWLLTGIWHGADWTFIFWGLCYFILLVSEKYLTQRFIKGTRIIKHIYTLFFVNLLWIPFRATSLSLAANYIVGMFGGGRGGIIEEKAIRFIPLIVLAVFLCFPCEKLFDKFADRRCYVFFRGFIFIALACLAICSSINASYTPYIYGNF